MKLSPEALDRFAKTYYQNPEVLDIGIEETGQQRSLAWTLDALGDARRVLEMGFGTGLVTGELLKRGVGIEVVEGAPALAAEARSRHADSGLVVHEAMFDEFSSDEPFDAVLAMHVAEHVDDPVAMFRRIATWLKPGGAVVVVVPNKESLHRRLAVMMGLQSELDTLSERDHLVGHQRVYSFETLAADLGEVGFTVRKRFGYGLKVVPNAMMLGWPTSLHDALIDISPTLAPEILANIGVRAELAS